MTGNPSSENRKHCSEAQAVLLSRASGVLPEQICLTSHCTNKTLTNRIKPSQLVASDETRIDSCWIISWPCESCATIIAQSRRQATTDPINTSTSITMARITTTKNSLIVTQCSSTDLLAIKSVTFRVENLGGLLLACSSPV